MGSSVTNDSTLEMVKAQAFELYLQQFPNVNLTVIANTVCRDRSRVSRWATDGKWKENAEKLRRLAQKDRVSHPVDEQSTEIPEEVSVESFDKALAIMSSRAAEFLGGQDFHFTSPNELIRFLEVAEKHNERRRQTEREETGGDDRLTDSSLPNQVDEAIRAGLIIINTASQLPVSDD